MRSCEEDWCAMWGEWCVPVGRKVCSCAKGHFIEGPLGRATPPPFLIYDRLFLIRNRVEVTGKNGMLIKIGQWMMMV